MPARRLVLLTPALLVALAACGGSDPEPVFPPQPPATPVSAAPVPGLSLPQEQLTSLVVSFREEYPALSDGRTDSQVVQSFVDTCTALAMPPSSFDQVPAGSDPGTVLANAALPAFTTPTAAQPLPSVSDAAGLGTLAQRQVCPAYTAP